MSRGAACRSNAVHAGKQSKNACKNERKNATKMQKGEKVRERLRYIERRIERIASYIPKRERGR